MIYQANIEEDFGPKKIGFTDLNISICCCVIHIVLPINKVFIKGIGISYSKKIVIYLCAARRGSSCKNP
jgi:hypothetical protein